jgi:uncharacterized membrane protein YedE/YeeE
MIIETNVILGALLLGLSAGLLLLIRGRILGCSGMIFRSLSFSRDSIDRDSLYFVLGLFISGFIFNFTTQGTNPNTAFHVSHIMMFVGGLLVGGGTYLANGCTSGHGLCGLALMRKRSIVAVLIFFPVAIIVSWLVH